MTHFFKMSTGGTTLTARLRKLLDDVFAVVTTGATGTLLSGPLREDICYLANRLSQAKLTYLIEMEEPEKCVLDIPDVPSYLSGGYLQKVAVWAKVLDTPQIDAFRESLARRPRREALAPAAIDSQGLKARCDP